ncbi:MAG: HAD family hydrolase, partial [Actinomycetes bacterium]
LLSLPVVTASWGPTAAIRLGGLRLDRWVDLTVGGFAGSDPYPKGALLRVARLRAEEKYGVRFADAATVYIADSPRDVAAARVGGARSVAVASGRASTAELRDAGADAVLPDLTDPAALISLITA